MQEDSYWDIVYNGYHKDNNVPISPITIYPALSSHTVEILITADSIPKTWFYAGIIYHYIDDPNSYPAPKLGEFFKVPVNKASIYQFKNLTDNYWLQYHPYRWFLWQSVRVRVYRFG